MTAANIGVAVTEMCDLFRSVWTPRPCDYPNSKFTMPGASTVWARWRVQHATGGQDSLSGALGQRLFEKTGTIFVQVFTPLNAGVLSAYGVASEVINAYEGKRTPSDVWFRNVRLNEPDGREREAEASAFYQLTVIADFEYTQLK